MPEPLDYSPPPGPKQRRQAVGMVVVGVTGFLCVVLVTLLDWSRVTNLELWLFAALGIAFLVVAIGGVVLLSH